MYGVSLIFTRLVQFSRCRHCLWIWRARYSGESVGFGHSVIDATSLAGSVILSRILGSLRMVDRVVASLQCLYHFNKAAAAFMAATAAAN